MVMLKSKRVFFYLTCFFPCLFECWIVHVKFVNKGDGLFVLKIWENWSYALNSNRQQVENRRCFCILLFRGVSNAVLLLCFIYIGFLYKCYTCLLQADFISSNLSKWHKLILLQVRQKGRATCFTSTSPLLSVISAARPNRAVSTQLYCPCSVFENKSLFNSPGGIRQIVFSD